MSVLRPTRPEAPSGRQFELTAGRQRAVIVEVGGGLREYAVDGQPVLDGYAADAMADGGRWAHTPPARAQVVTLIGAILAALLAAGCATIPSSGPVGSTPTPAPPGGGGAGCCGLIVEGPQPGWTPEQIVSGLLLADAVATVTASCVPSSKDGQRKVTRVGETDSAGAAAPSMTQVIRAVSYLPARCRSSSIRW